MSIYESEFETNKAISKPPRPVPGLDDDELFFLIFYFLFFLMFFVIGLGVIPNLFHLSISQEVFKTFALVFFLFLPIISLTLIKIFKFGKAKGYLEQSLYMFFKSNLPDVYDLRDSDIKKKIKKKTNYALNMINTEEFFKISKIKNKKIERFNKINTINEKISKDAKNEKENLINYYKKENFLNKKSKDKYKSIINNYCNSYLK